jgi:hypothetical protein
MKYACRWLSCIVILASFVVTQAQAAQLIEPPITFSSSGECSTFVYDNYYAPTVPEWGSSFNAWFNLFRGIDGSQNTVCDNGHCVYYQNMKDDSIPMGSGCSIAGFVNFWPEAYQQLQEEVHRYNNKQSSLPTKRYGLVCPYEKGNEADKMANCSLRVGT